MSTFNEQQTEEQLQALHIKEEEDLVQLLAKRQGIPYLDLSAIAIDVDALTLIPEQTAREAVLAVVQAVGRKLKVAVRNPDTDGVRAILDELTRKRYAPQLFLASHHSLEKAWERYKEAAKTKPTLVGVVAIEAEAEERVAAEIKNTAQLAAALQPMLVSEDMEKISQSVDLILASALALAASDIHIQPSEKNARLRLRLDGALQDVVFFNLKSYRLLLSRIKLLSGIKFNIQNRAQDGRFTIRLGKSDIEVRTSMLPEPYGESVVMRLLNPKTIAIELGELGMQPPVFKKIEVELTKPNGMILTTGPTGSGKTTTLYTFLKKLITPDINIITIEDPIEYHLAGVTQTQADASAGYDFGNGLRSILRQDPDVILVGEIRDFETAEIAMHAALTGHLVFSTLHTNNAAGIVPRLLDLGIKANILGPAINVAMAQRLVRRLCPACATQAPLEGAEREAITAHLASLPAPYQKPDLAQATVWHEKGCDKCNNSGFKGRIGIFEVFLVDDEAERLFLTNPAEADVRAFAARQGMLTMQQDGILKVLAGITSWAEVGRVVGE